MNEIYELKKALLVTRREHARALYELAELQLKVPEEEHKVGAEKPTEAEMVDGNA